MPLPTSWWGHKKKRFMASNDPSQSLTIVVGHSESSANLAFPWFDSS